jgi:RNA polymerase sigma-70 factor, ECF subfamily
MVKKRVMDGDITQLLRETAAGDKNAEALLAKLVYRELRNQAAWHLSRERRDHTLQATALVNEVYLRLAGQLDREWKSRAHFFGVAAHLMRLILIDHARAHRSAKRGGDFQRVSLDELDRPRLFAEEQYDQLVALDGALADLEGVDLRAARVVELRFFADLSNEEAAAVLGVSPRTVKREWQFARVWLYDRLSQQA